MPTPARWRRLGVTGIAFLISLAFLGWDHYWDLHQGRKDYDRALARLVAVGVPADLAAMKPPPPAGKNGVDLYLKALHLAPTDFGAMSAEVLARDSKLGAKLLEIDRKPSDVEWKDLEDRVRTAEPDLALFLQAASSSDVVYPLHFEEGWTMLMPHLRPLLDSAKLMCWDLRLRRRAGTTDGTWERIDALFGMADSLAAEPMMISQLIRLSLVETGLTSLEEALVAAAPPPEWRTRLERRLDPDRLRDGMRRCSIYELALCRETITRFLRGEPTGTELDRDITGFTKWTNLPDYVEDGAKALDRLGRIRAALDLPAAQAIPASEAVQQEFKKDPISFSVMLARYSGSWRRQSVISARVVLAREAMRIRSRFTDLGSAPYTVKDLAKDPLFDRPLKFYWWKEGFALEIPATPDELQSPWDLEKPPRWVCRRTSK